MRAPRVEHEQLHSQYMCHVTRRRKPLLRGLGESGELLDLIVFPIIVGMSPHHVAFMRAMFNRVESSKYLLNLGDKKP